jgi:hypothetical protein
MLTERQNPKEGFLFVSQTREKGVSGLEVRRIHEAMANLAQKSLGTEKAKGFKTKMLRSFYNSALLRADIKDEVKDLLMGHRRLGAKAHYGYDETTIQEAYSKTFPFLSINGMQSREDLSKIKEDMNKLIGSQQVEIEDRKKENLELKTRMGKLEEKLSSVGIDPKTISKMLTSIETLAKEVKRLSNEPEKVKIEG